MLVGIHEVPMLSPQRRTDLIAVELNNNHTIIHGCMGSCKFSSAILTGYWMHNPTEKAWISSVQMCTDENQFQHGELLSAGIHMGTKPMPSLISCSSSLAHYFSVQVTRLRAIQYR